MRHSKNILTELLFYMAHYLDRFYNGGQMLLETSRLIIRETYLVTYVTYVGKYLTKKVFL